jgi:hypothetical protein
MTLLNRLRILASHARRGLHAECPRQCSEGHTYRRPCTAATHRVVVEVGTGDEAMRAAIRDIVRRNPGSAR